MLSINLTFIIPFLRGFHLQPHGVRLVPSDAGAVHAVAGAHLAGLVLAAGRGDDAEAATRGGHVGENENILWKKR